MATRRKILFRWIKVVLLLYGVIGILFYYLQNKIFFHPKALPASYQYSFGDQKFEELNLAYNSQSNINIILFKPATDTPRGVVLFFHGNRRNIEHYAEYAPVFTSHQYEVWMIDYPGFGKSTGQFSEPVLYEWALQFYKLARARYSPDSIIIYGKSLGTGIAAQLASIRDSRRLILETPYYDLRSIARPYLFMYPLNRMIPFEFPTWKYLQITGTPVTIFHGTDDGVIPFSNCEKLKSLLKPGSEFITIKGGSHNNLLKFPQMREKLEELLK